MVNVDTLEKLYFYIENENIATTINKKQAIRTLTQFYDSILKNKVYKGKMVFVKNLIVKSKIARKLMSCYDARCSYSEITESMSECTRQEAIRDLKENSSKYIEVYELLDDESKKIFLNILMFRITRKYEYIVEVVSKNRQYFSDKIEWREYENVIDCGAYIGDTLLEFIEEGKRIKNYYLYELDDNNFKMLVANCEKAKEKGITTYPSQKGVYSENKTLYFEPNADSSKLVDYQTESSIQVVALDEDVLDEVSFIKMDVEGSELEAIEGAKNIIKNNKPTLAICLYHKQDDFWKIPLRIKEICPEYSRFWIEHYTCNYNETVLYVSK